MNSPSTNVAVMYSSENNGSNTQVSKATAFQPPPPASSQPSIASLISVPPIKFESTHQVLASPSSSIRFNHASMPPPPPFNNNLLPSPDPVSVSDADLLLNLHSPFSAASPGVLLQSQTSFARTSSQQAQPHNNDFSPTFGTYTTPSDNTFGDMVIDTQDVDMSLLGADMMPWDLEYLPHDMLYFGEATFGSSNIGDAGHE
jgi:hypothetical protein